VPAGGHRPGLGFAVADHAGHDQVGVVERRPGNRDKSGRRGSEVRPAGKPGYRGGQRGRDAIVAITEQIAEFGKGPRMSDRTIEGLGTEECLRLISPGGIGRIAYQGRFGPAVLPVNYRLHEGAILFRTAEHSPMDEDLRTGITSADYLVAFEIDEFDLAGRLGWSVLIQGPAHRVESEEERAADALTGVEPWPGGERELFVRIVPSRITGRRISPSA
jgi:nitroimidazol reductase NimA-like FMN-containing flavoprotein (pyridoxamine 5'-phosphate oxidase superfamily)